jgi:ribose transport system ATP-binding protein
MRSGGAALSGTPALALRGLSKSFGGEQALDDVTFVLRPGEIHGLVGENGSGKSTLIKILAGYHAPDAGELEVHGEPVSLPLVPGQFRDLGLEFVHQDLGLVPSLTVAENLCVGEIANPSNRFHVSWSRQRARTREILDRYGVEIDASQQVGELKPLEQAMVAIVRAVEGLRGNTGAEIAEPDPSRRILVFDEPTVFLPRDGTDMLFRLLRDVVAVGASVIFVSHKLHEVKEVTDRLTVLRDGRVVATAVTADTDNAEMIRMIVGHDLDMTRADARADEESDRLVTVTSASGKRLQATSFSVRAGEIVGVTGLVGAGFEELPYLLVGAARAEGGTVRVGDTELSLETLDPPKALRAGIALVPADRKRDGGVLSLTIGENVTLPVLRRHWQWPLLRRAAMRREAVATLQRFHVSPADPDLPYSALSGGNQQKVLLAKWLQTQPKLLVLHEPTQGVDVGAREQLHELIRRAADDGMAVICASSDYEQLALLCERVFVVADGRVIDELRGELTEERIAERCYGSMTLAAVMASDTAWS